jgi:hypothetical protein
MVYEDVERSFLSIKHLKELIKRILVPALRICFEIKCLEIEINLKIILYPEVLFTFLFIITI